MTDELVPEGLHYEPPHAANGLPIQPGKHGNGDMQSPDEYQYEDDDSSSDDSMDEIQYCDCVLAAISKTIPLPGTPGKRGQIPYTALYDTQQQARKRGYWIPGVPVNAKITKVEKNTDPGIHLINSLLYTIDLEHGNFKWRVVRNYKDFTLLHSRLRAHRLGQQVVAPMRRAQHQLDTMMESVGIDIIPDHDETCPYYKRPGGSRHHHKRESKVDILKRTADAFDRGGTSDSTAAPASPMIATIDSLSDETMITNADMERAVQSGILEDTADKQSPKKKQRRRRQKHALPSFPMMPDSMVSNLEHRKEQLENWLQMVLHIPINRNHHETAEFLEVSRFSFVNDLGGKHTEGFVKKRPGGNRVFIGWKQCCVKYLLPWSKRWLMVRDSFVAYMDHKTETIRLVLLMDKDFKVSAGGMETQGIPRGLIITNTQHELHLKCRRIEDTARWKEIIEQSMQGQGKIWIDQQRFGSSFPVRENCYGKWFVDAKSYMALAADMMELAREEIFIADWWLSPEIYMKRPALEGTRWRLDQILKRKAEQGVRIFVLLYKEMEMALGLNSIYTKKTLQGLHPNVKVMRHPDHSISTGTFFWAHHEKLLVIDQLISFVGGVDLCFGRWDDNNHQLTDMGSVHFAGAHGLVPNIALGLRSLAKAPLTLSPLGLEEDEQVTPTGVSAQVPPPSIAAAETTTPHPPAHEHGSRLSSLCGDGVDEVDATTPTTAVGSMTQVRFSEDQPPIPEDGEDEVVFSDRDTGNVMVKIWRKVSATRSKSEAPTGNRISAPPGSTGRPSVSDVSTIGSTTAPPQGGGSGQRTFLRVVEEAKGSKHVRRSTSALTPSRKRVPTDMFDRAGPASSIIDKAHRSGMDLATAAEKYREYVESGAVAKEKHRAQTPPLKRKENRISKSIGNWRANRARRKWKQVLDSDEVTAAYELDWLRLQEMDTDDKNSPDGGGKLWVGKDYVNYIHKDFVDVNMPFSDFIDRGVTPRMPWHDIHSVTFGAPARDVARHFIQRWNATKTEKLKDDSSLPYLLPKSYENLKVPRVFRNPDFSENVNVQVLRSMSKWSGLVQKTEDSIQMAYLSLIANAKHYVYIENQFFVSMIDSVDVLNEICKVLCNRVLRAHKEKQNFRVYIMIPLLPGFEGDVGAPGGSSLQAVLHWTYQSLSQGPHSLLERLKQVVPDPMQYIHVGSLRTHDLLGGRLITELVYIHSKLLIVDDEHVVIGSANINDRSQCGNRDSEVCLLFSDVVKEPSLMDGRPYQAGKFAKGIRLQCMKEHLGLLADGRLPAKFKYDVNLDDPVAPSFFVDVWQATARSNMTIYEEVFRAYPTNHVETFEEYQKYTSQMSLAEFSPQQAEEKLRDVCGSLVEFPLNFLCKATLTPGITSKEGLVPTSVFT